MKVTKRVTIEFSYDEEDYDHPSEWEWAILLDLFPSDIHRVEVFSIPTAEETGIKGEVETPCHPLCSDSME